MHVIFVVSAPPSCYYGRQHVIFVVGVVGCNHFISFSSFVYVMSCYCRLRRRRRYQHVIIVANAPSDGCHCRRPSQTTPDRASCTEFTQNKIHHADDDDDARHQAAQHNHHRPIAGRAPRRPRVQTVRDVAAARRRAANADDATASTILLSRRQRQFFPGAVAIATMHLSTRNSSRGKRLLMAHSSIITASAIARPLSSSSQHHQSIASDVAAEK